MLVGQIIIFSFSFANDRQPVLGMGIFENRTLIGLANFLSSRRSVISHSAILRK